MERITQFLVPLLPQDNEIGQNVNKSAIVSQLKYKDKDRKRRGGRTVSTIHRYDLLKCLLVKQQMLNDNILSYYTSLLNKRDLETKAKAGKKRSWIFSTYFLTSYRERCGKDPDEMVALNTSQARAARVKRFTTSVPGKCLPTWHTLL
jgi:hypothetical protein